MKCNGCKCCGSSAGGEANILTVGPGQQYNTLQAAVDAAKSGDIIEIDASGVYFGETANTFIDKSNITIKGVNGRPKFEAAPNMEVTGRKGIWVLAGNDVTVDNIEFLNAHDYIGEDQNWAGIRIEPNVSSFIKNCYFHHCDNGILGSAGAEADIVIESCEFAYLGYGDGYSHCLYIGESRSLTFRFNYSHHARNGHLLKTRAHNNYIEYNRITDEITDGKWTSGGNIDMPQGGNCYVIGNVMQHDKGSSHRMLWYGLEWKVNPGKNLYIINNTFINDDVDESAALFINVRQDPEINIVIKNNIFTGLGDIVKDLEGKSLSASLVDSSNLVNVDPGYMDRLNYDFRLTADSCAAIDKGVDPGTSVEGYPLTPVKQYVHKLSFEERPVHGAIDIGAYEYDDEI